MIGLNKRDIKKALKAGAKAGGVSLADVRADIEATIGLMSIFWTQKVKLFYAALLANNSH